MCSAITANDVVTVQNHYAKGDAVKVPVHRPVLSSVPVPFSAHQYGYEPQTQLSWVSRYALLGKSVPI